MIFDVARCGRATIYITLMMLLLAMLLPATASPNGDEASVLTLASSHVNQHAILQVHVAINATSSTFSSSLWSVVLDELKDSSDESMIHLKQDIELEWYPSYDMTRRRVQGMADLSFVVPALVSRTFIVSLLEQTGPANEVRLVTRRLANVHAAMHKQVDTDPVLHIRLEGATITEAATKSSVPLDVSWTMIGLTFLLIGVVRSLSSTVMNRIPKDDDTTSATDDDESEYIDDEHSSQEEQSIDTGYNASVSSGKSDLDAMLPPAVIRYHIDPSNFEHFEHMGFHRMLSPMPVSRVMTYETSSVADCHSFRREFETSQPAAAMKGAERRVAQKQLFPPGQEHANEPPSTQDRSTSVIPPAKSLSFECQASHEICDVMRHRHAAEVPDQKSIKCGSAELDTGTKPRELHGVSSMHDRDAELLEVVEVSDQTWKTDTTIEHDEDNQSNSLPPSFRTLHHIDPLEACDLADPIPRINPMLELTINTQTSELQPPSSALHRCLGRHEAAELDDQTSKLSNTMEADESAQCTDHQASSPLLHHKEEPQTLRTDAVENLFTDTQVSDMQDSFLERSTCAGRLEPVKVTEHTFQMDTMIGPHEDTDDTNLQPISSALHHQLEPLKAVKTSGHVGRRDTIAKVTMDNQLTDLEPLSKVIDYPCNHAQDAFVDNKSSKKSHDLEGTEVTQSEALSSEGHHRAERPKHDKIAQLSSTTDNGIEPVEKATQSSEDQKFRKLSSQPVPGLDRPLDVDLAYQASISENIRELIDDSPSKILLFASLPACGIQRPEAVEITERVSKMDNRKEHVENSPSKKSSKDCLINQQLRNGKGSVEQPIFAIATENVVESTLENEELGFDSFHDQNCSFHLSAQNHDVARVSQITPDPRQEIGPCRDSNSISQSISPDSVSKLYGSPYPSNQKGKTYKAMRRPVDCNDQVDEGTSMVSAPVKSIARVVTRSKSSISTSLKLPLVSVPSHPGVFQLPTPIPPTKANEGEKYADGQNWLQRLRSHSSSKTMSNICLAPENNTDDFSYVSTLAPDSDSISAAKGDPFEFTVEGNSDKSDPVKVTFKPSKTSKGAIRKRKRINGTVGCLSVKIGRNEVPKAICRRMRSTNEVPGLESNDVLIWEPSEAERAAFPKKRKRRSVGPAILPDVVPSLQLIGAQVAAPVWEFNGNDLIKRTKPKVGAKTTVVSSTKKPTRRKNDSEVPPLTPCRRAIKPTAKNS